MRKVCHGLWGILLSVSVALAGCSREDGGREVLAQPPALPIQLQQTPVPDLRGRTSSQSKPFDEKEDAAEKSPVSTQAEADGGAVASDSGQPDASALEPDAVQKEPDLDLTQLSSTLLYAEVFNMNLSPEDYRGRTIRLTGSFASFPRDVDPQGNPMSEERVYVCMIYDAMACCAMGVEFIPKQDSSFWQSPPKEGEEITVTGLCDIFLDESGWFTVVQLDHAVLEQR